MRWKKLGLILLTVVLALSAVSGMEGEDKACHSLQGTSSSGLPVLPPSAAWPVRAGVKEQHVCRFSEQQVA